MKYLNNFNSLNENLREKSPVWKVVDENFVYIRDLGYEVSPKLSGLDFCIVYITKNIGNPLDDLIDLGEELKSLEKLLGVKYEIKFGFSISSRSIGADIKFTEKKKGENKISIDDLIENKFASSDDESSFLFTNFENDGDIIYMREILNSNLQSYNIRLNSLYSNCEEYKTFGDRISRHSFSISRELYNFSKSGHRVISVKNKDLLLDLVSKILIYILGSRKVELVSKEIIGNDFKFKFKLKG